jgi:hypothetical protein
MPEIGEVENPRKAESGLVRLRDFTGVKLRVVIILQGEAQENTGKQRCKFSP